MEPGGEANPAPHPTDDEELALPPQRHPPPPSLAPSPPLGYSQQLPEDSPEPLGGT